MGYGMVFPELMGAGELVWVGGSGIDVVSVGNCRAKAELILILDYMAYLLLRPR